MSKARMGVAFALMGVVLACPPTEEPEEGTENGGDAAHPADAGGVDAQVRVDAASSADAAAQIVDAGRDDAGGQVRPDAGSPDATVVPTDAGTASDARVFGDGGGLDGATVVVKDGGPGADAGPAPDAGTDAGSLQPPITDVKVMPGAWTFTAPGQSRMLQLAVRGVGGVAVPPEAVGITWVSTNPGVVTVEPSVEVPGAVVVTSLVEVGSTVLVARSDAAPNIMSDPVLIMVVALQPGVLTVDDDDIVFPRMARRFLVAARDLATQGDVVWLGDGGFTVGPFAHHEITAMGTWTHGGSTESWEQLVAAGAEETDGGPADAGVTPLDPDGGLLELDGGYFLGVVGADGGYVPVGGGVVSSPDQEMGSVTIPAVLRGQAPALGTVVLGVGLQPLSGRVVSAVERDGYALVQLQQTAPDEVLARVDLELSLDALRVAGLLSAPYEAALVGGPEPAASTSWAPTCRFEAGAQAGAQVDTGLDIDLKLVLDLTVKGPLDDPDRVLLRFGMEAKLGASVGATVRAGVAAKLKCKFPNTILPDLGAPLPPPLSWMVVYGKVPEPFATLAVKAKLEEVTASFSPEYTQPLVVGMEYRKGQPLTWPGKFKPEVDGLAPKLKISGLEWHLAPVHWLREAQPKVAVELGVKMEFGLKPQAVLEKIGALLTSKVKNLTLTAAEGSVGFAVEFSGDFPYGAATRKRNGAKVTPSIRAGLGLPLDWTGPLQRWFKLPDEISLVKFETSFPSYLAPSSENVRLQRNTRTPVWTRESWTDKDVPVLVSDGDEIRVDVDLTRQLLRAPTPFVASLGVLDDRVWGMAYVDPENEAYLGGASRAFDMPNQADFRMSATWRVPAGFCTTNGKPTSRAVPVYLADVSAPIPVPTEWTPLEVGAGYGGTLPLACGVARLKVTHCSGDPVSPSISVAFTGVCTSSTFEEDAPSDSEGYATIDLARLPEDCAGLRAQAEFAGRPWPGPQQPVVNARLLDLGTWVAPTQTTIVGQVVDDQGAPVSSATVLWRDFENQQVVVTTGEDGRFRMEDVQAACNVRVTAQHGVDSADSATVASRLMQETDVGVITFAVVQGTLAHCDASSVGPGEPVVLTGDCGMEVEVFTDAGGRVEVPGSQVDSACGMLWLEAVVDGRRFAGSPLEVFQGWNALEVPTLVATRTRTAVEGRVVDRDGMPMASATVTWEAQVATSDADGTFAFGEDWSDCSVIVSATVSGQSGTSAGVPAVWLGTTYVGDVVVDTPVGGTVVLCSAANPAPGTTVTLVGDCGTRKEVVTNGDGAYSLPRAQFPPECASVRAEVELNGQTFTGALTPLGTGTTAVDLGTLVAQTAWTVVKGSVVDAGGEPAEEAEVTWNGTSVTTDAHGRFNFDKAWGGCAVVVEASGGTLWGKSAAIPIVHDGETDVGVVVMREPEVVGRLARCTVGVPWVGQEVMVMGCAETQYAVSDEAGEIHIKMSDWPAGCGAAYMLVTGHGGPYASPLVSVNTSARSADLGTLVAPAMPECDFSLCEPDYCIFMSAIYVPSLGICVSRGGSGEMGDSYLDETAWANVQSRVTFDGNKMTVNAGVINPGSEWGIRATANVTVRAGERMVYTYSGTSAPVNDNRAQVGGSEVALTMAVEWPLTSFSVDVLQSAPGYTTESGPGDRTYGHGAFPVTGRHSASTGSFIRVGMTHGETIPDPGPFPPGASVQGSVEWLFNVDGYNRCWRLRTHALGAVGTHTVEWFDEYGQPVLWARRLGAFSDF